MASFVHNMFQSIAYRYDIANDLISLGTHRLWRKRIGKEAQRFTPTSALDICTGTGEVALELANNVPSLKRIIGLDFVQEMVNLAEQKRRNRIARIANGRVNFLRGDGTKLPFPDNSFDLVTISFGIRNIPVPVNCLREANRVLKPGGRIIVLEFGQPNQLLFSAAYNIYSSRVLPTVGGLVTGNREAYEYLPETASKFPCGDHFCRILEAAGFRSAAASPILFGAVYLYLASSGIAGEQYEQ